MWSSCLTKSSRLSGLCLIPTVAKKKVRVILVSRYIIVGSNENKVKLFYFNLAPKAKLQAV